MSHHLSVTSPAATIISASNRAWLATPAACRGDFPSPVNITASRRDLCFGFLGTVVGGNLGAGNANAARKPSSSSTPQEKKDPSLSALQAKILASKRRKEAMKEAVAKLREKGTPSS